MSERDRVEAELDAIMDEIGATLHTYSPAQRDSLHRLEGAMERYEECVAATMQQQWRDLEELHGRMVDMEAKRFADRMEVWVDVERWGSQCAAIVGHTLEGIEETLANAMEAAARGEDVAALLLEAHGAVCALMADIKAANEVLDEGKEA